jgi:hypothetical protein
MSRKRSRIKKITKNRKRRLKRDSYANPVAKGVGKTFEAVAPAVGLGAGMWALGKSAEALPKIGSAVDSIL